MSWHPAWQENHDTALKYHVEGGHLSYAGIAAAVNLACKTHYSRNACIGRAGRLGLTNPYWQKLAALPRKPRKPQAYKPRPKRQPIFQPAEYAQIECTEVIPQNVALTDLSGDGCRWPYGDGPFTFCNRPQLEGLSYCLGHMRRATR